MKAKQILKRAKRNAEHRYVSKGDFLELVAEVERLSAVLAKVGSPAAAGSKAAPKPAKPAARKALAKPVPKNDQAKSAPKPRATRPSPKKTEVKSAAKPAPKKAETTSPAKPPAAKSVGKKAPVKSAPIPKSAKTAPKKAAAKPAPDKAAVKPTRAGKSDDLRQINGIGPVLVAKLGALGITRVAQIAAFTANDVERISDNLKLKGRIERDRWVEQAKALNVGAKSG